MVVSQLSRLSCPPYACNKDSLSFVQEMEFRLTIESVTKKAMRLSIWLTNLSWSN
jgi:hypothetical protein